MSSENLCFNFASEDLFVSYAPHEARKCVSVGCKFARGLVTALHGEYFHFAAARSHAATKAPIAVELPKLFIEGKIQPTRDMVELFHKLRKEPLSNDIKSALIVHPVLIPLFCDEEIYREITRAFTGVSEESLRFPIRIASLSDSGHFNILMHTTTTDSWHVNKIGLHRVIKDPSGALRETKAICIKSYPAKNPTKTVFVDSIPFAAPMDSAASIELAYLRIVKPSFGTINATFESMRKGEIHGLRLALEEIKTNDKCGNFLHQSFEKPTFNQAFLKLYRLSKSSPIISALIETSKK